MLPVLGIASTDLFGFLVQRHHIRRWRAEEDDILCELRLAFVGNDKLAVPKSISMVPIAWVVGIEEGRDLKPPHDILACIAIDFLILPEHRRDGLQVMSAGKSPTCHVSFSYLIMG